MFLFLRPVTWRSSMKPMLLQTIAATRVERQVWTGEDILKERAGRCRFFEYPSVIPFGIKLGSTCRLVFKCLSSLHVLGIWKDFFCLRILPFQVIPDRDLTLELGQSFSKVLTNEKRGGLIVVAFDRSPFKQFTLRFASNRCRPHPVRGLKLLSEPYFCHLKSIIVCQ